MPNLDDNLAAKLEKFLNLYKQGILDDADLRAALRGLGFSAEDIQHYIERQINVAGNYIVQSPGTPPPAPTLDDDTAYGRYLRHVVEANRRLPLQGIRSTTDAGLVSIELEEIYITLTATVKPTITDEERWLDEAGRLAPGEGKRWERQRESAPQAGAPHAGAQQMEVKVQEALREHSRLVCWAIRAAARPRC